jgi:hypothetical protein
VSELLQLKAEPGFPVTITGEAITLKNNAVMALGDITSVSTVAEQTKAAEALAGAARVTKAMEAARVAVKAPILEAGAKIDTMAKDYSGPVTTEITRVRAMVNKFAADEAARVAEENRLAEEKARLEREAFERKQREEAEAAERLRQAEAAELRRQQDEAEARRQEEARVAREAAAAAEKATEDADGLAELRATAAAEEAKELERQQEAEREQETQRLQDIKDRRTQDEARQEAERLSHQSQLVAKPQTVAKVAGIAPRKVWKFDVVSYSELYAAHPELCEISVITSAVNAAIKAGLRECPGLVITEEVQTHIRTR